jgi:hypothetical protein
MVRAGAAVQQHPYDLGAARQGSRMHDRRGVRRTQQIRRLRQHRGEPGDVTTVSEIPRPRHATSADAAPGHLPWAADQSHGERADLREDRPAVLGGRDRGLQRPAEVPQPPAGQSGCDRQAVMAVPQAWVSPLAVTTGTAQPLGKEQLLHRPAVSQVAREQRAQLIVALDPLIQDVDQTVDGRLAADPFEQAGTAERLETRRMIQQAAMLKASRPDPAHAAW